MIDLIALKERYSIKPNLNTGTDQGNRVDIPAYLSHNGIQVKNIKTNGTSTLYILETCIFDSNHSGGESAIGQAIDGKLFYQCFHDSCKGRTWKEARQIISGNDSLSAFMDGYRKQKDNAPISNQATIPGRDKKELKDVILPVWSFVKLPVDPREYYLLPWLKELSLILISGARGCGKSWFTLSILIAVSTGTEFGPWKSLKSVPCLYLDGEMATQDPIDRLLMLQVPQDAPLFIYSDSFATSQGLPRANLTNREWRDKMKSLLLDLGVKLWAIDNVSSLAPGLDENSKQEWDPINQWLIDLRFSGISTILVHHMGKSGTQRGTSGKEDNVDISIELVRPSNYTVEDGCRFIARFTKARVEQKNLALISDTEFGLITSGDHYTWTFGNVRKEIRKECLSLLADGKDQKSICSILGVSKGHVSKLRKSLIEDGLIHEDGKITPKGTAFLGEN